MNRSYGGLLVADGATSQNLGTTPAKLTGWASEGNGNSEDFQDQHIDLDLSNDQVKVREGTYLVSVHISGTVPAADDTYKFFLAKNDCRYPAVAGMDFDNDGTLLQLNISLRGIVKVREADLGTNRRATLSVYGEAGATRAFTPKFGQFNVIRLGG